jgi:general stress protein 26
MKFPKEFKKRINNALMEGHAVVVAYIDTNGEPHSSFYGSVHAYSDSQLGLWARNPEGELMKRIDSKPIVSITYADLSSRSFYKVKGSATLVTDDTVKNQVFEGMNQFEQSQDAERKGNAILIDVTHAAGRDEESGMFELTS